jgi:hypothetical protein
MYYVTICYTGKQWNVVWGQQQWLFTAPASTRFLHSDKRKWMVNKVQLQALQNSMQLCLSTSRMNMRRIEV